MNYHFRKRRFMFWTWWQFLGATRTHITIERLFNEPQDDYPDDPNWGHQ